MIETIICYDLDGTLIDSAPSIYDSLKYACDKNKLLMPEFKKFKSFIGPPLNNYLCELLEIDKKKAIELINDFRIHHDKFGYKRYKLFDKVHEILNYFFKKNISQYIITNKPEEITLKASAYLGISKFFNSIYSTTNKYGFKKNKSTFMKEIKLNNNLYYVGDTENDKIEAEKSKSEFIFADYGYGNINSVNWRISNPYELIDLIKC